MSSETASFLENTAMADITPYQIEVPDWKLDDLKKRLALAKFPEDELEGAEWDYGTPLADVKRLTAYWRDRFDWPKAQETLNRLPHFTTEIQCDGFESLKIHFIHKRSGMESAIPLLFVHGWPGSFLEATKIMEELTRGGEQPAFHFVTLSLPNYGFSEGSKKKGFAIEQYAETCNKLMLKLGYDEYVTQGGDWGFRITRAMSLIFPDNCLATHLNRDTGSKPKWIFNPLLAAQHAITPYTKRERDGFERSAWFREEGSCYHLLQSTKPQTLGYALADSPVALLAWIYEKLHDWTDGYPWTEDEVCLWISVYWFSTAGPAANIRIYYESVHSWYSGTLSKITRKRVNEYIPRVKIGMSHFPRDIRVYPKTWNRVAGNVVFQKEYDRGGHFAAWERPDAIVSDLREMFGKNGGAYDVVKGKNGYAASAKP